MVFSTRFLNVMSVCLIALVGVRLASAGIDLQRDRQLIDALQDNAQESWMPDGDGAGSLPDIYYIILDGYARADVLRDTLSFDNTEFLAHLEQEGFYVAHRSRSNYCWTPLSLASSLNFSYIHDPTTQSVGESETLLPIGVMIEDSQVYEQLRDLGYTTVAFSSGFPLTELKGADLYLRPPGGLDGFQMEILSSTPLYHLLKVPFLPTLYQLHRDRILFTLERLAHVAQDDTPVFVFAHIIAPHPPYVFGRNGEPLEPDDDHVMGPFTLHQLEIAADEDLVRRYTDQLAFINTRVQLAIEEILARSSDPPIIILQADHGPGDMAAWSSMSDTDLWQRVSILNAYYFPDGDYGTLYEDITPVNSFRVVANEYFGTAYEMLDDDSYFSASEDLQGFIRVPDRVWADRDP
jgi:hypothetical protein